MEQIIIQKAIIVSFSVIAIWCCYLEGMIFGKIRDLNVPEWLEEPLFACPVCMQPYYGSAIYWVFICGGIKEWVIVIMVAMGIATIFVKLKRN